LCQRFGFRRKNLIISAPGGAFRGDCQHDAGDLPAYPISEARNWAAKLNEVIERGEDPRAALRVKEVQEVLAVAMAHTIYMEAMRRGDRRKLKPRTLCDKEVIFSRDIEPRLGSVSLYQLSENECWDSVYDKAKASKVRANKMAG